jgi:hypothetical protein
LTIADLFYPTFVLLLAGFVFLTIPRRSLRPLFPYGVVLGGLGEAVYVVLFHFATEIVSFQDVAVWQSGGHRFLSGAAWILIIMIYLYFWPQTSRYLSYAYYFAWAVLATGFSQVVSSIEVFRHVDWFYPLPMLISYLLWFALAAWAAKPWHSRF